ILMFTDTGMATLHNEYLNCIVIRNLIQINSPSTGCYGSLLLKHLDNRACCRSFRICILDLKGNQNLKCEHDLLHLHDNIMGTRKNIEDLSGCLNLSVDPLRQSPLCLKGKYRHCVVNSIWSLKTLDNFVISDEEIIENWKLIKGWKKVFDPLLILYVCPLTKK
uniref:Leucine-rich repeats and IQ motif containing 3 n=1 Tax=Salmo trutta TaxID=8032 RepID=A0A673WU02_SALTR